MSGKRGLRLVAINHDPQGLLARMSLGVRREFQDLPDVSLVLSPATMAVYEPLELPVHTVPGSAGLTGQFRVALNEALRGDCTLLIDYDRLLHYLAVAPDDLRKKCNQVAMSDCGFLFLGRLPCAFASHPDYQIATERLINDFVSDELEKVVDCMSGTYGLSRAVARAIHLKGTDDATNSVYPRFFGQAIRACARLGLAWDVIWVGDGLGYETPDRWENPYREEFRRLYGGDKIRRIQMAGAWPSAFLDAYRHDPTEKSRDSLATGVEVVQRPCSIGV